MSPAISAAPRTHSSASCGRPGRAPPGPPSASCSTGPTVPKRRGASPSGVPASKGRRVCGVSRAAAAGVGAAARSRVTALFAIFSAILAGGADFLGGFASRRAIGIRVAVFALLAGLPFAFPLAVAWGYDRHHRRDLVWSAAGGAAVGVRLRILLHGDGPRPDQRRRAGGGGDRSRDSRRLRASSAENDPGWWRSWESSSRSSPSASSRSRRPIPLRRRLPYPVADRLVHARRQRLRALLHLLLAHLRRLGHVARRDRAHRCDGDARRRRTRVDTRPDPGHPRASPRSPSAPAHWRSRHRCRSCSPSSAALSQSLPCCPPSTR